MASKSAWVSVRKSTRRGRYWRSRHVRVLIAAALPGRLGIAEVDLDSGRDGEPLMLGHLMTQIPSQRLGQPVRQGAHRCGQCIGDRIGLVVTVGQRDEHQEPGGSLHQGGDRAHVLAEDQVAFPVSGHRPVLGLCWPLGDVQRVRTPTTPVGQPDSFGPADNPAGAQVGRQFPAQGTTRLDEQGSVDALVRHLHLRVVGIADLEPASDLLRRPPTPQLLLHHRTQHRVPG